MSCPRKIVSLCLLSICILFNYVLSYNVHYVTGKFMQLTPNFQMSEFTVTSTGKANVPNKLVKDNIRFVACCLQYVRDAIGLPIVIDSGYRSDLVNRLVGGSPTSLHLKGLAVDIRTNNIPYKVFPMFLQALLDTKPYEIHINSHAMLHVSWHPDRDKLIQDDFSI